MDLDLITRLSDHFKLLDEEILRIENHKIETLLNYFNLPKYSENCVSIEKVLKWDNIGIYLPEKIFVTINFKLLAIPNKVKFYSNLYDDQIYIFNQKIKEHFPYPAKMDRINFIKDYFQEMKIDLPFHSIDFIKAEMLKKR